MFQDLSIKSPRKLYLEVGEGFGANSTLPSKTDLRSQMCPSWIMQVWLARRLHRVNVVRSVFDDWNLIMLPSMCILNELVKTRQCHTASVLHPLNRSWRMTIICDPAP